MYIENHQLITDEGVALDLPLLAQNAQVAVYTAPIEAEPTGYYLAIRVAGQNVISPYRESVLLGVFDLAADVDAASALQLNDAKQNAISRFNSMATEKIELGFWYEDTEVYPEPLHFSYDATDQINFGDAKQSALDYNVAVLAGVDTEGLPSSVAWNGYTDIEHQNLVVVTFNISQFNAFRNYAVMIHKDGILATARDLKAQVVVAETAEAVNDIVWPEDSNAESV